MGQVASRVQATVMSWYSDQLNSETSVCSDSSANPDQVSEIPFFLASLVNFGKPALSNRSGSGSKNRENGTGKLNSEEGNHSGDLGPDDFQLLACVGQGGFSKVYQCRKNGTEDIFAMKVIIKHKFKKIGHLMAERDILTKVDHPLIMKLHYSFQTSTKLYLLFDFINGGDLSFHLSRQQMFSEEHARICIAELVCAVAHLHEIGIIHRDLKPDNILLDSGGHVKLTDFGLAKEVDDSTKSNTFCGTPEYMAPEIILADSDGKPADWWSVGILLYGMLTGETPFCQPSPNRLLLQRSILKSKLQLPTYLTSEAISLLKGL